MSFAVGDELILRTAILPIRGLKAQIVSIDRDEFPYVYRVKLLEQRGNTAWRLGDELDVYVHELSKL